MSRTRGVLEAQQAHIRTLYIGSGILVSLCLALIYGWSLAPQRLTIDIPPDIRNGATQRMGERSPPFVYQFGFYIFQQLNRWPNDGANDYRARIETLRPYLSPSCYQNRKEDFEARNRGMELRGRERFVAEMPGRGYASERVYIESDDSWVVWVDLQIVEIYRGERVKDTFVRYPLRIVSYHGDPETNRYGLMLDCFSGEPQKIDETPSDGQDASTDNDKSSKDNKLKKQLTN